MQYIPCSERGAMQYILCSERGLCSTYSTMRDVAKKHYTLCSERGAMQYLYFACTV